MRIKDIIQMGRNYLSAGFAFFIVVILIFCIGYFVVYKKVCKGTKKLDFKKVLWWTIFALYLLAVISVTMLSRGDFWNSRVVSLFYSYKEAWVSASASAWRNIVLNILMFVPFGFWLPIGLKHFRVFWKTYLAGFAFTLVIETSQLALSHGIFEVADLVNNTVGAMIGFGCYEIVWQIILFIKKKKVSVVKLVFLQLPLVLMVGLFATIYVLYEKQELGNLPVEYISPYRTSKLSITSDEIYQTKSEKAMVYKSKILTVPETEQMAKEFFEHMETELDESRTDIYDETAFYWAKDHYNMDINYKGGSYDVADFDTLFPTEEVDEMPAHEVNDASEQTIREALKAYGITMPEEAVFTNDRESDGIREYRFEVEQLLLGNKMYDGTLYCTYYDNGRFGNIMNSILEFDVYKEFEIFSEQEAYEQILNGKFSSSANSDSKIEVGKVELKYMLDTKGFYQPIYVFDAKIDGRESEIQIPAVK